MKALLFLVCLLFPFITASSVAYPSVPDCSSSFSDGGEDLQPLRRETYGSGWIFDISHRITSEMPAWGSTDGLGPYLRLRTSMKNGSLANSSEMKLPAHTRTHLDAPGHVFDHYFDAGFYVDSLDMKVLNGPALLVDVPRDKNITAFHVTVYPRMSVPKFCLFIRRLMYTKEFDTSYAGFTKDGAQRLVDNKDIKLVRVDYLAVAAYDDAIPSHLVFLEGREIILAEGLKLDDLPAGIYSVHCLPLRLVRAEGSPMRCILIN
ncbi:hypothetical protein CDL15_Pgr028551 [Punica granatum]|uniref:Cyclase-like protein 2 n=1 Tax=Punica granatum TaxID=22663 RepID=A0A218VW80_PUNGR|nr:hypothetical protein CDL15_Pgr028551 [Punica granatum]